MRSPASPRTRPDHFPVICTITTRVSDMDGYGHLNAIRIGQLYEEARASFYTFAFDQRQRDTRILVAELSFQYLGEGFWPGEVQIGTGIARINSSTFLMGQALFQIGGLLGMCRTVLVCPQNGRPVPLPQGLRDTLDRQSILTTSEYVRSGFLHIIDRWGRRCRLGSWQ